MSQVFFNLPVPSASGVGTPVDVHTFGPMKTIAVSGNAVATILVEISNDVAGTNFASLCQIQNGGQTTLNVACRWMRATVLSYRSGTPVVNVGGTDEGTTFAQLVAPAADGAGAPVDVIAQGLFKTVQVSGTFSGNVNVEISEDGVSNWATIASFASPGKTSLALAAHHMRVRRNGASLIAPGLPIIWVGATEVVSGNPGIAISAGAAVVGTGTIDFSNANGITFGLAGSVLTASVQTAGGTATGVGISAGTEVATTGAVVFSDSNGVSFGLSAQTLTATVAPPLGVSAGSQSVATGTVVLANSNGLAFGMSGSTRITGSYSQSTAPAAIAAGTQTAGSGTIVLSDSNGISFGMSGSTRITASYTQSTAPAAISAGGASVGAGTVVFSDSNSVSFGLLGSTVTASAYQPALQRTAGFTATGGESQFTVTFAPPTVATDYQAWAQCINVGVSGVPVLLVISGPGHSVSQFIAAVADTLNGTLSLGDEYVFFLFHS